MLAGIKIVPHELAREVRTEFKVSAHATRKKKRKNWRVLRVVIDRPCCIQIGSTFYMHPELIAKLKETTP